MISVKSKLMHIIVVCRNGLTEKWAPFPQNHGVQKKELIPQT